MTTRKAPPKRNVRTKPESERKTPSATRRVREINDRLLVKYEKFARHYLLKHNATAAAIECGSTEGSASRDGYDMLHHPVVMEIIRRLQAEMMADLGADFRRVTQETARIAFFDPRTLFDDKGVLIPIHLLSADTAAAISSIECKTKVEEVTISSNGKVGKPKRVIETHVVTKIRLADKNAALDRLTRVLGHDKTGEQAKRPLVVFNFNMPRAPLPVQDATGETIDVPVIQQSAIPRPPAT